MFFYHGSPRLNFRYTSAIICHNATQETIQVTEANLSPSLLHESVSAVFKETCTLSYQMKQIRKVVYYLEPILILSLIMYFISHVRPILHIFRSYYFYPLIFFRFFFINIWLYSFLIL